MSFNSIECTLLSVWHVIGRCVSPSTLCDTPPLPTLCDTSSPLPTLCDTSSPSRRCVIRHPPSRRCVIRHPPPDAVWYVTPSRRCVINASLVTETLLFYQPFWERLLKVDFLLTCCHCACGILSIYIHYRLLHRPTCNFVQMSMQIKVKLRSSPKGGVLPHVTLHVLALIIKWKTRNEQRDVNRSQQWIPLCGIVFALVIR